MAKKTTPWLKLVNKVYKTNKKTNKNYKFGDALKDAKKVYNGGNALLGSAEETPSTGSGSGSSENTNLLGFKLGGRSRKNKKNNRTHKNKKV